MQNACEPRMGTHWVADPPTPPPDPPAMSGRCSACALSCSPARSSGRTCRPPRCRAGARAPCLQTHDKMGAAARGVNPGTGQPRMESHAAEVRWLRTAAGGGGERGAPVAAMASNSTLLLPPCATYGCTSRRSHTASREAPKSAPGAKRGSPCLSAHSRRTWSGVRSDAPQLTLVPGHQRGRRGASGAQARSMRRSRASGGGPSAPAVAPLPPRGRIAPACPTPPRPTCPPSAPHLHPGQTPPGC